MRRERGSAVIEMSLVGIVIIFVMISVFELSRGMWVYHTLAHAVRAGTRYAIVHGQSCLAPCQAGSISTIAAKIKDAGVGLIPLTLTFTASSGAATTCVVDAPAGTACSGLTGPWPLTPSNQPGQYLTISATYPFASAIALLWPGSRGSGVFPTHLLAASSRELIQY